jgi:hypothetical protein
MQVLNAYMAAYEAHFATWAHVLEQMYRRLGAELSKCLDDLEAQLAEEGRGSALDEAVQNVCVGPYLFCTRCVLCAAAYFLDRSELSVSAPIDSSCVAHCKIHLSDHFPGFSFMSVV